MSTSKIFFTTTLLFLTVSSLFGTTIYVNAEQGSDRNDGSSKKEAIQSLQRAGELIYAAGDSILLASGMIHRGALSLNGINGSIKNPIVVTGYMSSENSGGGCRDLPVIDAAGYRNGILLTDCSHIVISGIEITGNGGGVPGGAKNRDMRCGILVQTSKPGTTEDIVLENLILRDLFYENPGFVRGKKEVKTANGTQNYGWGIRVINRTDNAFIKGVTIRNCDISNVAHTGIKFTVRNQSVEDVNVINNRVTRTGGPGIQFSGVLRGHVKDNHVNYSGSADDSRKWGRGSGLWTWSCSEFIIENNTFRNANGPGDSAGCHIDFNCKDVIVQFNVSENNAGGFCEILGNNHNCAYRFNISINDGHRVKHRNGAFQEGKIFWLSGFVGSNKKRNGPFNSYFYNNTIYVKSDIQAKVAVDRASKGVLVANNIFYIEGESKQVLGDQYKPEVAGESEIRDVVFHNNLFLKRGNWPAETLIQDDAPFFGDPGFINRGGIEAVDYTPTNRKLVKDRGVRIEPIPGDERGLFIGLNAKKDILGNPLKGLPDMGAIQLQGNYKQNRLH